MRYVKCNSTGEVLEELEVEDIPFVEDTPTELEQIRADVDYIAVMTGVEL